MAVVRIVRVRQLIFLTTYTLAQSRVRFANSLKMSIQCLE